MHKEGDLGASRSWAGPSSRGRFCRKAVARSRDTGRPGCVHGRSELHAVSPAPLTLPPELGLQTAVDGHMPSTTRGSVTDGSVPVGKGRGAGKGSCAWPGLGSMSPKQMSACP